MFSPSLIFVWVTDMFRLPPRLKTTQSEAKKNGMMRKCFMNRGLSTISHVE